MHAHTVATFSAPTAVIGRHMKLPAKGGPLPVISRARSQHPPCVRNQACARDDRAAASRRTKKNINLEEYIFSMGCLFIALKPRLKRSLKGQGTRVRRHGCS